MKKQLLLLLAIVLAIPLFAVVAKEPVFEVGHIFYTNKSPFLLEGMVEPGSTVMISGIDKTVDVGIDGKFAFDLPLKEGVNLFSLVIDLKGIETIKCVMVEKDSTPPEVTLLVKDKQTQEKSLKIEIYDASEFTITGFTEPGCKILADEVDYSTGNVKFEAKFKVGAAPSKSNHKLEIIDKFGNKTEFDIYAINVHVRTIVLQFRHTIATIDGKEYKISTPPEVQGGTTMIPVKFVVVDVLGGTVSFDTKTKTLTAKADNKTIIIQAENKDVYVNDKKVTLVGRAPMIRNSVMVAPFRFIGEEFGFLVSWQNETKTITMTKPIYE